MKIENGTLRRRRVPPRPTYPNAKYRHQINSVVNDDTIAWLRLKQGQGQSYQSLSQIVRTLLEDAHLREMQDQKIYENPLASSST
jgi:hypothetical protein